MLYLKSEYEDEYRHFLTYYDDAFIYCNESINKEYWKKMSKYLSDNGWISSNIEMIICRGIICINFEL